MKSTVIQMQRGYAETYVTILSPQKLQVETIEQIKRNYDAGMERGRIIQPPNSKTDKECEVEWYRNGKHGVTQGLDYYGFTLEPDWSSDNHERFEKLKKLYPKEAFGSTNVAPKGFKEITVEEFANGSAFGGVIARTYSFLIYNNDGTPLPFRFWCRINLRADGSGFGYRKVQDLKNGGKVLYYVFNLCEHEFESVNVGNCLTRYNCLKCKYSTLVDSSG